MNIFKVTENFKEMNHRMCKLYHNKVVEKKISRGAYLLDVHMLGAQRRPLLRGEECSLAMVPVVSS